MLSVIVPVYNVENYLKRCVESILEQSYGFLEIILVDDGSTDNSGNMCDEFAKTDKRIKVIHKLNGGLSSARNAGLENASGEYIAFVDSDDYLDTYMYEKMISVAQETGADFVQCGYRLLYVDNEGKIKGTQEKKLNAGLYSSDIMNDFFQTDRIDHVAWNKLYKKDILKDVKFVEGRIHEDTMATFDTICQVSSFVNIEDIFYNYIKRADSISGEIFKERSFDSVYAAEYIKEKCDRKFSQYYKYANCLVCLNCAYLYIRLENSNIDRNKKIVYRRKIKESFSNSWSEIKSTKELFLYGKRKTALILLYRYFRLVLPSLYSMQKKVK